MKQDASFKKDVESWRKEGIINSSQAQAILAKYGLAEKPKKIEVQQDADRQNKFIIAVSIIGTILIGLGLILFVASNWQRIPAFLKLFLLIGTTFGTYYVGYEFVNKKYPLIGQSILFLGSLFVGASIFLTAQIFNIQANVHWLVLLWFISVAPLSYAFNSKPTLVLSLALFATWLSAFHGGKADISRIFEGFFSSIAVFLYYGLTLFGLGYLHEKTSFAKFKGTFQTWGMIIILTLLYSIIVSKFYLLRDLKDIQYPIFLFLFGGMALATTAASGYFVGTGRAKIHEFLWNGLAFVMSTSIFFLVMVLGDIVSRYTYQREILAEILPYLIIFDVLFFCLIMLTILVGYYQGISSYVNLGLLFFVLFIGYIYFETFFQFLPKSLALIAGGILLLVGGWVLEKKRKELVNSMGGE